jgi:hypothetical protein
MDIKPLVPLIISAVAAVVALISVILAALLKSRSDRKLAEFQQALDEAKQEVWLQVNTALERAKADLRLEIDPKIEQYKHDLELQTNPTQSRLTAYWRLSEALARLGKGLSLIEATINAANYLLRSQVSELAACQTTLMDWLAVNQFYLGDTPLYAAAFILHSNVVFVSTSVAMVDGLIAQLRPDRIALQGSAAADAQKADILDHCKQARISLARVTEELRSVASQANAGG